MKVEVRCAKVYIKGSTELMKMAVDVRDGEWSRKKEVDVKGPSGDKEDWVQISC